MLQNLSANFLWRQGDAYIYNHAGRYMIIICFLYFENFFERILK